MFYKNYTQKMNIKLSLILVLMLISFFNSFSQEKCGHTNFKRNKADYLLCDSLLQQDTIYENYLFGDFDTIHFVLPQDYKIIEETQSFLIVPSIWALSNANVSQYISFDDLKVYCVNEEIIHPKNDNLINSFENNQSLINLLYFNKHPEISKNDLLNSIKKQYDKIDSDLSGRAPDEYTTSSDLKKWKIQNENERKIYTNYLNKYTTWKNAPRNQYELLIETVYITITLNHLQQNKKITFVYNKINGN